MSRGRSPSAASCPIRHSGNASLTFPGVDVKLEPVDPREDMTAAIVLAVVSFLLFGATVAMILTDTLRLDSRAEAWVGAGLIGLGSAVLAGWYGVLYAEAELPWGERLGGDLVLAGLGIGLVVAGLPTFAAGVI